jgi:hypothetical protein
MAKRFMRIRRVVIPFLTLAIMLSQLSGCAVVSPSDIVDNPDDVTLVIEEPDLDAEAGDKDTAEINGEKYDISGTVSGDSQDNEASEHKIVEMPQDMLHALFKEQYDAARMAEKFTKEYGTDSYDFYKKLSAQDIGTQEDANVYNQVKAKVYGFVSGSGGVGSDSYSSLSDGFGSDAKYYGKYNLPTDGFAQYVSWRQQYEASLTTSNSSTAQEPSQKPSNNNNTSSGSGNQSQPSGGSTPPNNTGNNGNNGNSGKYSGDGISDDLLNEWNSGGKDKELPKPDYEIIG